MIENDAIVRVETSPGKPKIRPAETSERRRRQEDARRVTFGSWHTRVARMRGNGWAPPIFGKPPKDAVCIHPLVELRD